MGKSEKVKAGKNEKKLPYNYWREDQPDRFNGTIFDYRIPKRQQSEAYVVDGVMGYGKTSAAINFINDQPSFIKFVYITPYLKEIERIKSNCPNRNFITPEPKNKNGSKMSSLLKLLDEGRNIIATHALFRNLDERSVEAIKVNNYILIMDEVADVIEKSDMTKDDIKFLLALDDNYKPVENMKPVAKINKETDVMEWLMPEYRGKLEEYRSAVELGCLIGHGSQISNIDYEDEWEDWDDEEDIEVKDNNIRCPSMMMWNYPASIYKTFFKIFILTYMFEGQIQCGYYKLHNIPYKYIKVERSEIEVDRENKIDYNFIPEIFNEPQQFNLTQYQNLIHIEDNYRYNSIGYRDKYKKKIPLSKSWYNSSSHLFNTLKKNTYNYFTHLHRDVDAKYRMWTTFKSFQKDIQDKGYTKNFVELNSRGTNEFKDRYILAYLVDRYPYTPVLSFLNGHGIEIDIDQFALSEMLQWIFRSRIREGKEIWIYIPSLRMRNLLKVWMGLESEQD